MLDMGFEKDIIEIQDHCTNEEMRSMIFSATVPNFIQNIAAESMENPLMIDMVGDDESQLPSQLKNKAIVSRSFHNKLAHIKKFITENKNKKIIVFCETKKDVDEFGKLDYADF